MADASPTYIEEGVLRHVRSYPFEFVVNAKKRWFGRRLVDVFVSEFRAMNAEYYVF